MDDDRNREDNRTFQMWFKINVPDADSFNVSGLTISKYSRLKHKNQCAYDFIKEMIETCEIIIPNNTIECIWKSVDDVDYELVKYPPESYPDKENESSSAEIISQSSTPNKNTSHSEPSSFNNDKQVSQKPHYNNNGNDLFASGSGNSSILKNKSKVWEYFTTIDSKSARCKFCQSIIKTSGNTTNLRGHINSKHKMFIATDLQLNSKKRCVATSEQPSSSTADNKKLKTQSQMSNNPILDMYQRVNSYADGGVQAEKLTNSLLYMMAVDHMPLRCVEKKGLQQFVKTASPHYTMPSRRTITKLMVDKYDVLKMKIMDDLKKCSFYSITCDIWTDVSQKSYLGATVHYLANDNLEIKSINLCVRALDVEHTVPNISTSLLSIFESFDLQMDKVTAMISDSAPNMVRSINDIVAPDKDKRLPCFAHRVSCSS